MGQTDRRTDGLTEQLLYNAFTLGHMLINVFGSMTLCLSVKALIRLSLWTFLWSRDTFGSQITIELLVCRLIMCL